MIATYPYFKDDAHEWCKEIAVTMVEKDLGILLSYRKKEQVKL